MLVGPMGTQALLRDVTGLRRASALVPDDGRLLSLDPSLHDLLGEPGLRRGTTVSVSGVGATSLSLVAVAAASREAWVAAVGFHDLGLVGAEELGVDLGSFVVVPDPRDRWLDVLGALVDAFDVVLARPKRLDARSMRRLSARVRERDAAVVTVGSWTEPEHALHGVSATWHGLDDGHGHLAARALTVRAAPRRAPPREQVVWLPGHDGRVSAGDAAVRRLG